MPARLVAEAFGDSSLMLTARGGTAEERRLAALGLHRALEATPLEGVDDHVHAVESVLVLFDCAVTDAAVVRAAAARLDLEAVPVAPRTFRIPVRFGGVHGPDLDEVAAETGRTRAAVLADLAAGEFVIAAVGGNLIPLMQRAGSDRPLPSVARMRSPRIRVPAGSVGLAGDRVCVYPVEMPGGWRLVGRTDAPLLDLGRDPVAEYRAGDLVRFVAEAS